VFENRRASRVILVQYIFSNLFEKISMEEIIDVFQKNEEDFYYNEEFLKNIYEIFLSKSKEIFLMIEDTNNRKNNIDQLILASLIAATSEMFINSPGVVIKEYLKISDLLLIDGSFVNGVLNKIYEKFFKKETEN
jgi:transcription termination factor NusB